ncbi:MAG: TolB family protein [Spirochaeta sp.]
MSICKRAFFIFLLLGTAFSIPAADLADEGEYLGHRRLQTEHTEIIFEPRDIDIASEVAQFADEVFIQVAELLGHRPDGRVPVVITDRTAWANGYYSAMPHRITLFVTSPSDRFLGSRTESWLRTLYLHELVHYIHLTEPIGLPGVLSRIFGPDVLAFDAPLMPLWWIEGIAVYAETALAPGGRGESSLFELKYKAPVLENEMWHRYQMRYASAYPPSDRVYVGGYIFVTHLIEKFGSEVFAEINRSFGRFPFFGIGFSIWLVTGESFADLHNEMIASLTGEFASGKVSAAELDTVKVFGRDNLQLPFFTERGWIGYSRTAQQGSELIQYDGNDPVSGPAQRLLLGSLSDALSFSVSEDGSAAVVAQFQRDPGHPAGTPSAPQGYSDLFRVDPSNGTSTRITSRKQLYHPTLSADAQVLAAVRTNGPYYELVEVNQDDGTVRSLYQPDGGSVYEPQISDDGEYIVAVEIVLGYTALVQVDVQSGEVEYILPYSSAAIYRPRIAPDGGVLFSSDLDGALSLYMVSPETGVRELVRDPVGVVGGEMSDDLLVYSVYRSSGYALASVASNDIRYNEVEWPEIEEIPDSISPAPGNSERPREVEEPQVYRDLPRPGLWLPFPRIDIDENDSTGIVVSPAIYWMMHSVLRRHSLSGSIDYHISDARPSLGIEYRYAKAWGGVALQAESRYLPVTVKNADITRTVWVRRNLAQLSADRVLWDRTVLDWSYQLQAAASLGYVSFHEAGIIPRLSTGAQLQYVMRQHSPAAAFYGRHNLSVYAGSRLDRDMISDGGTRLFLLGGLGMQAAVPWIHHALRLETDFAGVTEGELGLELLPTGGPQWQEYKAPVKARTTIMYRVPFGLYDQWIPYGGIVGAGAELYLQTAWYTGSPAPGVIWERKLYAGMELAVDMRMFSGAGLRPVIGLNARIDPAAGEFTPVLGEDLYLYFDLEM